MDELTLDGETYVSSKRAAKLTGYAKDYVGQLCREGSVEAKKVGRSWYVLESSILGHRFGDGEEDGEEAQEEATEGATDASGAALSNEENASQASPISDWERPTYIPETHQPIPTVDPAIKTERAEVAKSIADMQSAWQEWFEQKGDPQEALLESPEVIDAREEAYEEAHEQEHESEEALNESYEDDVETVETEIPFNRITPEPEATVEPVPEPLEVEPRVEAVPIQKIVEEPKQTPLRTKDRPVAPYRRMEHIVAPKQPVSIVAAALLAAVALLIIAIAYVGTGSAARFLPENPILDFLGGKSEIDNTRL